MKNDDRYRILPTLFAHVLNVTGTAPAGGLDERGDNGGTAPTFLSIYRHGEDRRP